MAEDEKKAPKAPKAPKGMKSQAQSGSDRGVGSAEHRKAPEKSKLQKNGPKHLHETDEDTKKRIKAKRQKRKGNILSDIAVSPVSSLLRKPASNAILLAGMAVPLMLMSVAVTPMGVMACAGFAAYSGAFYLGGLATNVFQRRKERRLEEESKQKKKQKKAKKNNGPEGDGQKQKPSNDPEPGAKPKVKGQDRDGQEAKVAPKDGPSSKPASMKGSELPKGEKPYWHRRAPKAVEDEEKRARRAKKADARRVDEFLATPNTARSAPESIGGGALTSGGKPAVAPVTPPSAAREKRKGVGFGMGGRK